MTDESVNLKGTHILVLEDNYLVAEVIREQLEYLGCEVIGPSLNVGDALKLVSVHSLDGALLDVNLAGEFCFPVAAALKNGNVPFVFLTGYTDIATIPIEFQSTPQILKPFDYEKLAQLIVSHFHPQTRISRA